MGITTNVEDCPGLVLRPNEVNDRTKMKMRSKCNNIIEYPVALA